MGYDINEVERLLLLMEGIEGRIKELCRNISIGYGEG